MIVYDKLKNVDTEEKIFNFICPKCSCNGMKRGVFMIKPVGVSWKPDLINNSGIDNEMLRRGYDKLPVLRNAIIIATSRNESGSDLSIYCNKCKTYILPEGKIDATDVRKWVNKNLPFFIDLRKREL